MDSRIALLREFYHSMQWDRLKLECQCYGFDFLDTILTDGVVLEYGELAPHLIYKYKLAQVPDHRMNQLLQLHVNNVCNVCLYFHPSENCLFCFNLDHNLQDTTIETIPEVQAAATILNDYLGQFAIEPFMITSGRGFHLWCRLDQPLDNHRLYQFMIVAAAQTMKQLYECHYDFHKVKFNVYPNVEIVNIASLRLFGSEHIRNKMFSRVCTKAGLLDPIASWDYFAEYMRTRTIRHDVFDKVCATTQISSL